MASIEYRKRTTRVVAYIDKEKQVFPIGRVTKKTAERFANNIDALLHERRVFVYCDVLSRVVEACPSWQWRTVVGLARYGGLRVSSEVALLKWSDISWDTDRFTVTSPKTKRYGKGSRVVPIFPELRPFLDEAFSMAQEGDCWVVPMLKGQPFKNLRTTFRKIIRRAGVEVWPKPFQNLRSSR